MIRGFPAMPPLPPSGAAQAKQGATVPDFGLLLANDPEIAAPAVAAPVRDVLPPPGERVLDDPTQGDADRNRPDVFAPASGLLIANDPAIVLPAIGTPTTAPRTPNARDGHQNDGLPVPASSFDSTRYPASVGLSPTIDQVAMDVSEPVPVVRLPIDVPSELPLAELSDAVAPLVTRSSTGDVEREVAAVPWHLQANSHLSWATSTSVSTPAVATTIAIPAVAGALLPSCSSSPAPLVPTLTVADLTLDVPDSSIGALNAGARSTSNARNAPNLDSVATSGWFAAWTSWPERLLRWQSESGGASTAWVRDFRLSSGDAQPLIDSLRDLAGEQGHSLRRIMLNGHEVWRNTPQSEPRG